MQQLLITVIGSSRSFLGELTAHCAQYECYILDSQFDFLRDHYSAWFRIEGNWNQLAKLENALRQMGDRDSLQLQWHRAQPRDFGSDLMPYTAEVTCPKNAEIANDIMLFFLDQKADILRCSVICSELPYTQFPLQTITLTFLVEANRNLSSIRESFLLFCDDYNVDGLIEPERS